MQKTIFWMCLVGLFLQWDNVGAFHDDVYQPRVPIELIEELQDIDNPYPATPERIELGKQIFYGKGLCVTCHSKNGKGVKQPGHPPRDFTDKKWQEIRTDGEMMWVLRNGSPGTEMPVRVGKVINEEEGWSVIHFIRTLMDNE
ncbi:MAG: c-type cytochrome [Nitrospinales bacterium]|nr:c-type cytochrome [Nitrospinales bacterium]